MIPIPPETEDLVCSGIHWMLWCCGENPDREGLKKTPRRFYQAIQEMTQGYNEDPREHLRVDFPLNDCDDRVSNYDELIISGGLPFVSLCEHHLLPFIGEAHIGYLPDIKKGKIVGLSKLSRLLDGYAKRFQVQERLTRQIGDAIEKELNPMGVGVVLKAKHTCQCLRGIKKDGIMITSAMYGELREDASLRHEFLTLIKV